jgi:hypothetical protein
MIFACRSPRTPATLFSRTDGLDMKVSTRQKQGATRHKGRGAKGDNSAPWVPRGPQKAAIAASRSMGQPGSAEGVEGLVGAVREPPASRSTWHLRMASIAMPHRQVGARHAVPVRAKYRRGFQYSVRELLANRAAARFILRSRGAASKGCAPAREGASAANCTQFIL